MPPTPSTRCNTHLDLYQRIHTSLHPCIMELSWHVSLSLPTLPLCSMSIRPAPLLYFYQPCTSALPYPLTWPPASWPSSQPPPSPPLPLQGSCPAPSTDCRTGSPRRRCSHRSRGRSSSPGRSAECPAPSAQRWAPG